MRIPGLQWSVVRRLSSTAPPQDPSTYCRELVRRQAHEHYLASLLLPHSSRSVAFALRALSCEVAAIRDSVSDRRLGQVRAQWWKDVVGKAGEEGSVNHPVARELQALLTNHPDLNKGLLQSLASSRDHFLSDSPFDTLEQVEQYGMDAFSGIYLLLLEAMGNTNGHAKHAVTQLGKCEGLVTLLRGTPHNSSKRRVYLPSSLLAEMGASQEGVLRRGPLEEGLRDVVEVVASRAQQHLEAARMRSKFLEKEHKLLLLPCLACDHYLEALSKVDCNLWDKSLHTRSPTSATLALHLTNIPLIILLVLFLLTATPRNSQLPLSLAWHKFRATY